MTIQDNQELESIPSIGKSLAEDLREIGIRKKSDLLNKDPRQLYEKSNRVKGIIQDPCVLYSFRCAVYYASTQKPQARLLKWWNWKDKKGKTEK